MQYEQNPARRVTGSKEAEDSLSALALSFTQYNSLVDRIVANHMGTSAYQSSLDAQTLLDREDELLTPDARAINNLFREAERDAVTRDRYGVPYDQLDEVGKFAYNILYASLTGSDTGDIALDTRTGVHQSVEAALLERDESISEVEILGWVITYTDTATTDRARASVNDVTDEGASVGVVQLRAGQHQWSPVTVPVELVSIATRVIRLLDQAQEIAQGKV
ncbi:hypothetical protein EYC59_02230 [Candidatus Saccharibacteria bacterium]|nr:MAG: hypothetical protein EYC59_02230 [Candidatus Saccharibacteria bacterium]